MALTNGNNFIFIHIYKCGGTSIRSLLTSNLPVTEFNHGHATARETRDFYYENGGVFQWKTSFKFTFVRNPFDLVVSLYEYIKSDSTHINHEEVKDMYFDAFCVWYVDCIKNKKQNPNGKFNTLTEFLFDDQGKLLVDFVGKLENIDDDIKVVSDRLKIPMNVMPYINRTVRNLDYRIYYSEESKQLITDAFYYDLVNFNYSF